MGSLPRLGRIRGIQSQIDDEPECGGWRWRVNAASDIGISTGAYRDLSLARTLDRIAELAAFAEITSWGEHSLVEAVNARAVEQAAIPFTVHGPFHASQVRGFWGKHRAIREMHRRHMSAAAELGAQLYVVHPDPHVRQRLHVPAAAAAFEHALEELRVLQAETGVRVAVENMPYSWLSRYTVPSQLDLEGLGFTLDVGHAAIEGALEHWLLVPTESLHHLHLHDNHGHNQHDGHMALGAGVVDAAPAVALARAAGASIVLEHTCEEDVLASLEHLRLRGLHAAELTEDEADERPELAQDGRSAPADAGHLTVNIPILNRKHG